MGFSKIRLGEEEIFTTIVEDIDGRELEKWKSMKKDYKKVIRGLNKRYGLGLVIIDKKQKKDKDLNWAI